MRNLLIATAAVMALGVAPAFAGGGGGGGTDNPGTSQLRDANYAEGYGAGTWRVASNAEAQSHFAALEQHPGYSDAPEHLGGSGR